MISGGTPAVANPKKRASGLRPSARARSPLMTTDAAAPSLICELFPAVVVPRTWKAGFSFAKASSDVSERGPSSISNTVEVVFVFAACPLAVSAFCEPLAPFTTTVIFTSTGTISSLNFPAAMAASAF